jgi:AcrR family transcriptional regulator
VNVHPNHQTRSRETLARLVESGAQLFADVGPYGFTLQELSQRSGVSIGSLYQRVPSKEALLREIAVHETARLQGAHAVFADDAHWRDLSTPALVDAVIAQVVTILEGEGPLLRGLVQLSTTDAFVAELGATSVADLASHVERRLLTRRDDFCHRDPEQAVDVVHRLVFSSVAWEIAWGSGFLSDQPLRHQDFVRELARACRGYLLQPDARDPGTTVRTERASRGGSASG